MACKVSSGIDNTCASRLKGSGLGKTFWVFYKSDLDTQISTEQTADIGTLDFGSYGGVYRMDGAKFSHDFTFEEVVGAGGNVSYNHNFNWKLNPDSTADDVTIQDLNLGDDVIILAEDLNKKFFILGAANGLQSSATTGGSGGKETGGDTAVSGTLTGNEPTLPLRFELGGGYDATLAYIEALEL